MSSIWRFEYGDGTSTEVPYEQVGFPDQTHAYASAGTYTATLYLIFPGETTATVPARRKATATVTVTGGPAVLAYGGYSSAYSFPNYAKSG